LLKQSVMYVISLQLLYRNMMSRTLFCLFSHHLIMLLLSWWGAPGLQLCVHLIFSVWDALPTI